MSESVLSKTEDGRLIYEPRSRIEFFLDHVEYTDSDCWLWTGALNAHGYGSFGDGGKIWLAHRWIFNHVYGLTEDKHVLHRNFVCTSRSCVNPEHLYEGTQADNTRDMVEMGSQPRALGSHNYFAMISESKVREVRQLFASGERQIEIARMLNLTKYNVWQTVTGRTWKDVV